jgi:hypothetical protein
MIFQTQAPAQTIVQQITPYIVAFVGVLFVALGLIVKAFADRIVKQLQQNHDAYLDAAKSTDAKVDTVITQTNGVNQKLQEHIDTQNTVIAELQKNQKPGETAT